MLRAVVAFAVARVLRVAQDVGGIGQVSARTLRTALARRLDRDELWRAMAAFGNASVPIVLLTAGFAGLIMVLQAAFYVRRYGAFDMVGWFAGISVLREIGPILICLMFSGRVGTSHTSEVATLRVTDKLDALRGLALDIYEIIILPRAIAMVVTLMALLILGDAVALVTASLGAWAWLHVAPSHFWQSLLSRTTLMHLGEGLLKTAVFGALMAMISTHYALRCERGARGVGAAVQAQVVACALALFMVDYLVAGW